MPKKPKSEKYDFESDKPKLKKAIDNLEQVIIETFGKQCKTKATGCYGCRMWAVFHFLKLNLY